MNISFDLYRYFFYTCEFKNITKASDFLYISQPALSKQIHQLESRLGKKLFIRTKSGIELTTDGESLYNDIKDSIIKLNSIENKYNEKEIQHTTTIKIIAGHLTTKNILLDTITKINSKYPTIKFEITTFTYKEAIELLHQGKCDLIFFCMKEVENVPSNICIKKLIDINDTLIVGSKLKDVVPSKISLLELNNYPMICKSGFSVVKDYIVNYYNNYGIEFTPKYQLSNNWLIEEYIKRNLGIGILTREFIKKELDSKELFEIETDVSFPSKELAYAYRDNSLNYDIIKEITKQLASDISNYAK